MPGHHDAANEYTSLEEAEIAAFFAIEQGLPGDKYRDSSRFNSKKNLNF